jgi:hypothetical protein
VSFSAPFFKSGCKGKQLFYSAQVLAGFFFKAILSSVTRPLALREICLAIGGKGASLRKMYWLIELMSKMKFFCRFQAGMCGKPFVLPQRKKDNLLFLRKVPQSTGF